MNWLHHLWFTYAEPSLYGNGPEDVIRTTVALVAAVIIVPKVRHWVEQHVASIKAHAEQLHKETREHAEELHRVLHERLDREGK